MRDPRRSFGEASSENALVHGDNLRVMRALRDRFEGRFKCAYLDPPFNTGRTFAEYNDRVAPSEWERSMHERLIALRPLVADDGAAFVEIDDNELATAQILLDSVFGRKNRISTITIVRSASTGHKAINVGPVNVTDFLLVYAKDRARFRPKALVRPRKGHDPAYGTVLDNPEAPPNELPAVALGAPVVGTTVTWGQSVTITATAADSDGTIARVEFYDGTTKIGEDATAPYEFTWTNAPAGTRTITARAFDNAGGSTVSAERTLVISNTAPTVSVTAPAPNAAVSSGHAVKITATAADSEGPVARVEFYDGATKLGEATTAPFQFSWNNVAAGTYSITAKATDTVGSTATTAVQSLVVTPNVEGMWATLNAAQKAGQPQAPNRTIGLDGAVDAVEVMTAIGVNTVAPKYVVAMAQALRRLADLPLGPTPIVGTGPSYVACPDGGTMMVQDKPGTTDQRFLNFKDCKTGGFTIYGGPDVDPYIQIDTQTAPPPAIHPLPDCRGTYSLTAPAGYRCPISSVITYTQLAPDRFRILVEGAKVNGGGTPEAANETFPHNAWGWAYVECTVTGGVKSCLTNHENSFLWGNDLAWTNWADNGTPFLLNGPQINQWNYYLTDDPYKLNGTVRPCQPDPQPENYTPAFCQSTPPAARHIKFENMTNLGGRAIVYGSDGWAVVTRLAPEAAGIERLQVQRTLTQAIGAVPAGQKPAETFRCPVDANGFFQCTKVN